MSTTPTSDLIVNPEQLSAAVTPTLRVYSPNLVSEEVQAFGIYYHAPARGSFLVQSMKRHPRRKTEGGKTVTIMDELEDQPGGTAVDCVKQILDRYKHKGYVVLMGDGRDEDRKMEADARHITWRIDYAQTIEANWIEKVAAFTANQPGAAPPRQPRLVREELLFLQKYRSGRLDRKEFICAVCSMEFDRVEGADGYEEHRRTAHPGLASDVSPVRNPAPAPAPDAVGVPGAVGDPGDNRGLVGAELLKEAKALKVDLLKAELIGLLEDDQKVIDHVIRKLAEAKAGKA